MSNPKWLVALAITVAAIITFGFVSSADGDQSVNHCPDKDNPGKVESGAAGNDVVLLAGTVFCVKGGEGNTGVLTADGQTTLIEYMKEYAPLNNGGKVPDVSYYIIYTEVTTSTTSSSSTSSTSSSTTSVVSTTTTVPDQSTTSLPTPERPSGATSSTSQTKTSSTEAPVRTTG